jgi:hypothetical protein
MKLNVSIKTKVAKLLDVGNSNIIFDSFYCIKTLY